MEFTGGSPKADHLCVLVHGLWGNPNHMKNIAKSLRSKYSEDELYLLVAKRNSGSFTYDGIELGGERVCAEIEEELRTAEANGGRITKLSIVGYSLGGLVARYAVGLLYARGTLDGVECVNFTTFASPHLGVRSPLRGWHNHVWNVLGARTLSMSGRQLFTIDKFRDTGRPLLAVLADPKSIFMCGLKKFRRHTLYTNIVNDRSAVHYTTGITKTDPYTDLANIEVNYVKGYGSVVLDPACPVAARPKVPSKGGFSSIASLGALTQSLRRVPLALALAVFVPIGVVTFLFNSCIQTVRSWSRIRRHESGQAGISISEYRGFPLWINEVRTEVEQAYEALNSWHDQDYLVASDSEAAERVEGVEGPDGSRSPPPDQEDDADDDSDDAQSTSRLLARERRLSIPTQPTLALAPYQFRMIQALDGLGWRKYPVWIHDDRHSHAAMIIRFEKKTFGEGEIVLSHWLNEEFLV